MPAIVEDQANQLWGSKAMGFAPDYTECFMIPQRSRSIMFDETQKKRLTTPLASFSEYTFREMGRLIQRTRKPSAELIKIDGRRSAVDLPSHR